MQNLLVVSNNNKITSSLVNLFDNEYCICVAENDFDGILDVTGDKCPDKIIVDCKDYAEVKDVLLKLKESFDESNIIVMSSFLSTEDKSEIESNLNLDLIIKPCNRNQLLSLLKKSKKNIQKKIDKRIIHVIVNSYSSKNVVLYRCYNRIISLAGKLRPFYSIDFEYIYDLIAYYIFVITTLEDHMMMDLLSGANTKKEAIPFLIEQLEKMRDFGDRQFVDFDSSSILEMLYISKRYNGKGLPNDDVAGKKLPFAARLLHLLFDFHYLQEKGKSVGESVYILNKRSGWYDDEILIKINEALGEEACSYEREVFPLGLEAEMVLAQNLYGTVKGKKVLVIKKGDTLTAKNIDYIHKHGHDILDVTEPILIREKVVLGDKKNA
ncbi:HD domain-containing phosphohydrolase [Maridesulfovibrio zosterae]|uniref:HD domain-containing phosphohydrolase n=1 Tax=Maridesulfovibrio zosterae TaxID=82171 RepID=UPI00041104F1|nr:HD domain-containing phosphohydrolase [Maridesulfovibrio zosterae]